MVSFVLRVLTKQRNFSRRETMPLMTLCKFPGCCNRVPIGTRFCDAHRVMGEKRDAEAKAARELMRVKRRGNERERGYTFAWRKAAKVFLSNHPLCAECARNGVTCIATCVDHIQPHRGNLELFWDQSNWQSLCTKCHNRKTAAEDGGFGNRPRGRAG